MRETVDWVGRASWGASFLAIGFFVLMVIIFALQSTPVWIDQGGGYLTGRVWHFRANVFGVLPMVYGTLVVSAVALLLAAPLAIGAALFTSEILSSRSRMWIKIPIELLAGIPSVVYGLLGVYLLRDWIFRLIAPFDPLSGDTLLTAGVLLAVMILPTVMTLADDALRSVPSSQRRASRGLGLTVSQTAWSISLPQAAPGIFAALLLGLGRALGETIAVFLVVGRQDNQWPETLFSLRPLVDAGQTLTSKLGGSETFIALGDPLHWGAMIGLALVLLVLVAALTLVGGRVATTRVTRRGRL